ncbi:hypothetical protein LAZ67_X004761 [Cordylochernes scorpioides]|uniref:Transposase n=1 Tax=Cordylochernes scorpioides TaxID=51811 RepID=A0ABY6LYJ3_9ARAC|nr:hypothetical protein LAZ67_X004761 [Cordylochernes scorpioides]
MLEMTRTDTEWKDKIITGDETWVYGYDPETKRQSAEWRGQGEPRPKKSRILKSRNKVLLVAFLDNKGIVHHEYLPAGQTVIKEMYLSILRRLREAIRKKRPEKWTNGDWILHHDNARPHTAHLVTSFLAKNGTEILPQPPYSPDIAPNDFFLFPKLKAVLKGRHFDTREDIIEKSLLALKSIPKEAYKNCFDNWEKRWRWWYLAYGSRYSTGIDIVVIYLMTSCKKEEEEREGFIGGSSVRSGTKEIGGEDFDDFGEHDIEELLVDEALNDDDILESMVDTTKDFETVDSELEDVTPLDEKLLREGLQLSGVVWARAKRSTDKALVEPGHEA